MNDYNNPVPWKELGKIDKDMVLLSPFWSDFATSTTDNAAKVKVRQYSEVGFCLKNISKVLKKKKKKKKKKVKKKKKKKKKEKQRRKNKE